MTCFNSSLWSESFEQYYRYFAECFKCECGETRQYIARYMRVLTEVAQYCRTETLTQYLMDAERTKHCFSVEVGGVATTETVAGCFVRYHILSPLHELSEYRFPRRL